MTAVSRRARQVGGDPEIEYVATKVKGLKDEHPIPAACWLGAMSMLAVVAIHALLGFNPAVLPLYVLPVWVATHFDGVRSGSILVGLASLAATYFHWRTGNAVGFGGVLTTTLLSLSTFGVMMLIMARMESLVSQNRNLALRDPLTGVFNRRALREMATKAMEAATRDRSPLVAVAIDCDGFKHLNDTYGHGAGDQVLRVLADVLQKQTRNTDLVARMGGDEFVIIFKGITPQTARGIIQRIESEFELAAERAGYPCTISIGIAMVDGDQATIDSLLESADQSMYAGKETKRTRAYLN